MEKTPLVHFRELYPSDIPRIAELETLCNPLPWKAEDLRPFAIPSTASEPSTLPKTGSLQRIGLVAEVKNIGEIAAYVFATLIEGEGEILIFGVDPMHRRRGLGRSLLQDLGAALKAKGCRSVFLEVRSDNVPALALYHSTGFIETGIRKGYYADTGGDARVLRWDFQG